MSSAWLNWLHVYDIYSHCGAMVRAADYRHYRAGHIISYYPSGGMPWPYWPPYKPIPDGEDEAPRFADRRSRVLRVLPETTIMNPTHQQICKMNPFYTSLTPVIEAALQLRRQLSVRGFNSSAAQEYGGGGQKRLFDCFYVKFLLRQVPNSFMLFKDWDMTEFRVSFPITLRLDRLTHRIDPILVGEDHVLELVSQPQPLTRRTFGLSVTLFNTLTDSFDTESICMTVSGMLIPVLVVVTLQTLKAVHLDRDQSTLGILYSAFINLLEQCINLAGLLAGQTAEHWNGFFNPLIKRISRMRITRWSLSLLAAASLWLVTLYVKMFTISLLLSLLKSPTQLINSMEDVLQLRQQGANLTFYGFDSYDAIAALIPQFFTSDFFNLIYPIYTQISTLFMTADDIGRLISDSSVLSMSSKLSCDDIKLADQLWGRRQYHCARAYSVKMHNFVLLNQRQLDDRRLAALRRLVRRTFEAQLNRRANTKSSRIHQRLSMAAHRFAPHTLDEAHLDHGMQSVSSLLADFAVWLSLITACHVILNFHSFIFYLIILVTFKIYCFITLISQPFRSLIVKVRNF